MKIFTFTALFLAATAVAASAEVACPLTDTGQSAGCDNRAGIACPTGKDAFAGQDAQFARAPQSFTDNGNGTLPTPSPG